MTQLVNPQAYTRGGLWRQETITDLGSPSSLPDRQNWTLGVAYNLMGKSPRYMCRRLWVRRSVRTHHDQVNSVCGRRVQDPFWQKIHPDYIFWLRCQLRVGWNQVPQLSRALVPRRPPPLR